MAAEAILKIKDAEDQAAELIKKAQEATKNLIADAQLEGEKQYKAIVSGAREQASQLVSEAVFAAEKNAAQELLKGNEEKEKILSPAPAKLAQAVQLVIERVVSNGNR